MSLDINYNTTNPLYVDQLLETAIEEIQNGAAGKVFTPDVTDAQRAGTVDATAAILASAAELVAAGGGTFVINGNLQCTSSIILPVNCNIEFTPGSSILPRPGGTFIADALFLVNCSDGITWDVPFPNIRGYARGIRVDNSANPSLVVGAMKTGVALYIENISTTHCHFNVKSTSTYLDLLRINGSMASEPQGSGYAIELANLGDGLSIRSSHVYISGGVSVPKNIRLQACMGGEIQGSIGGDIYLFQCRAIKMHGGHHETGTLTIDGSDVSVEDSMFWVGTAPKIFQVSNSGGERRTVSLKNVSSVVRRNVTSVVFTPYDLQVGTGYHTTIENCSRVWGTSSNGYQSEKLGIFVANSAGAALTEWNNYAYQYSRRGEITNNQQVGSVADVNCGNGTIGVFNSTTTATDCSWQAASGTYYYHAQIIYDGGRRLGTPSSSSEVSFTVTNGVASCPKFVVGPAFTTRKQNCFIRLYRGTVAGSYDNYVDLPILAVREITDRGDYCMSFPWISRTAGVMLTIFDTTELKVSGANVYCKTATIPPTFGIWTVGDNCDNTVPVAGGFRGCVCITAPATFKTVSPITA